MANIMIYGQSLSQAETTRVAIDIAMRDVRRDEDTVVTIVPSACFSCAKSGKSSPFLRVCATDCDEAQEIVRTLRRHSLALDCEVLLLENFHPAEEMKRQVFSSPD